MSSGESLARALIDEISAAIPEYLSPTTWDRVKQIIRNRLAEPGTEPAGEGKKP